MANWQNIKLNKKQIALSIIFIAAIIITLLLRLYYYDLGISYNAPDYIVSNDRYAALTYNKRLYVQDQDGRIISKTALAKAGIHGDIADMQLLDQDRILLADWDNKQILQCTLLNMDCSPLSIPLGKYLGRFFKFHYRADHNDILLADTDRHRILHYDIAKQKIRTISKKGQFTYPNHLQVENDGLLYVTNTNRHEITSVKINQNSLTRKDSYKVSSDVSPNKFPVYYYRLRDGEIFILQANSFLTKADLVRLKKGEAAQRISSPADADITVLSKMANRLLMTDRDGFRVYALSLDTMKLSEFGDTAFRQELKQGQQQSQYWLDKSDQMLYLMFATIISVFIFIAIVALTGKRQAEKQRPEQTVAESSASNQNTTRIPAIAAGEIFWLDKNPRFRYLIPVILILLCCLGLLMYWGFAMLDFSELADQELNNKLITSAILLGMIIVVSFVTAFRTIYYRIGTDGKHILFKRLNKIFKVMPEEILYTKQYLQFDNQTFTIRNNMNMCFHNEKQYQQYIEPLLSKATKSGLLAITLNSIRRPNAYVIFSIGSFILITGLFFYFFGYDIYSRLPFP